jgi:Protein of unknown function (DUF1344)
MIRTSNVAAVKHCHDLPTLSETGELEHKGDMTMKSQFAIGAVLALISASSALASETTGTITAINTKTDTITLSDGKSYALPEGIEAEQLKVGQKLHVTYSGKGGKWLASKVDVVR